MPVLWMMLGYFLPGAEIVSLIDFSAALLGGLIIGVAIGVLLVPVVVDRLHRGK